jgi:hypothetical protein
MQAQANIVGRVLRASTTGFDCGTRSNKIDDRHSFGSFVKVPVSDDGQVCAIGVIYAIRIDDDPLARELVMASSIDSMIMMDQRDNRMVPVEICAVNIGYQFGSGYYQTLPPRPPLSLSEVTLCDADEVYTFTQECDYFQLILGASDVPRDELMAAALRYASYAYPEEERYEFMVKCGRRLAVLLSNDLKRLSRVLTLIRPS